MASEKPKAWSNLFAVWNRREAELGGRITYKDVTESTGISGATLSRWMRKQVKQFDAMTIQSLCEYFQCPVGELILLEGEGEPAPREDNTSTDT